jgi:hypothetical protein
MDAIMNIDGNMKEKMETTPEKVLEGVGNWA